MVKNFLSNQEILGANFTFAKYSSKMQALLSGKEPNVFSAKFSGGALMDLGVYPVYAAIRLFGSPQSARYSALQLPNTVDLEVKETEPGIKGDTSSGGSKPATMETGLVVQVPFFVSEGDVLTINTSDGTYISRA